jgi:hypothetical protein
MAETAFYNDLITVSASMDEAGQIAPHSFTWQGKLYKLTTVGRQWETDEGRHILVESATGDRFELQLAKADLLWRLRRAWQEKFLA